MKLNRKEFLAQAMALSGIMIVPRAVLGGAGYIAPSDRVTLGFIGAGRQALTLQRYFAGTGRVRITAAPHATCQQKMPLYGRHSGFRMLFSVTPTSVPALPAAI